MINNMKALYTSHHFKEKNETAFLGLLELILRSMFIYLFKIKNHGIYA
jgi:hypothetical protein